VAYGAVSLAYKFAKDDVTKYRLKFSNSIDIRSDKPARGVVTRSFVYSLAARRARPTGASLDVAFLETRYKPGADAVEFDSRRKDHLKAASQKPNWRVFAAILSSKGTMRVKPTGEVSFFRLASVGKEYDDKEGRFYATKAIEEIKNQAFLLLPTKAVTKDKPWTTQIPIKFVGGPLAGNTLFAEVQLSLTGVESVDKERIAKFKLTSFKPIKLGIAQGSVKDVKVKLVLRKAEGALAFSPDRGQIRSYEFRTQTILTLDMSGRTVYRDEMDTKVSLERLAGQLKRAGGQPPR